MEFVVAIDGPAGSGKGTITKLVGKELGLVYIDTGATFRCVALNMLEQGIEINEKEKIEGLLKNIQIEMKSDDSILLNGIEVTDRIRQKDVSQLASQVATLEIVRNKLLKIQREIAKGKKVIMEGRDIGTVVFPNADVKIYLDASVEERAKRRMEQNKEKGIEISYDEVLKSVVDRDERDMNRELAPLKKADDAVYIDSSNLSIEEVKSKVIDLIKEKGKI